MRPEGQPGDLALNHANKDPGGYHADPGFASGRAAPFADLWRVGFQSMRQVCASSKLANDEHIRGETAAGRPQFRECPGSHEVAT